ncbi:LysM peptidoglycan-binding domain-containing protein [Nitrospirota bacterium]
MKVRVLTIAFAFILLFASTLPAQTLKFEYKEYKVVKGDTLWKISRAQLSDSFLWPMIWKENLRINNPDLIYPGQIIIIPIGIIQDDGSDSEAVKVIEAPPVDVKTAKLDKKAGFIPKRKEHIAVSKEVSSQHVKPIISREILIEAGYITRYLPDAGIVGDSPTGRNAYGAGDEFYLNTKTPVKIGQKFYAIKKIAKVTHPDTRKKLGLLVKVVAIVQTREAGTKGIKSVVLESFDLLEKGDRLDYFQELVLPFASPNPRKPQVGGVILNSTYLRKMSGGLDVVFLDKGTMDGLEIGDVLQTLMPNTDDSINSTIQIVNTRMSTSLGVVLKTTQEVSRGDVFEGVDPNTTIEDSMGISQEDRIMELKVK